MVLSVPERPHEQYVLSQPIKEGGEKGSTEITIVCIKHPRAKEMRLVPANFGSAGSMLGDLFPFAQQLCGLTGPEFDQIGAADLQKIMEIVGHQIEGFQAPGRTISPN